MEGVLSMTHQQSMVSWFLEIAVSQTLDTARRFLQARSMISKMTEEKASAIQQNMKLQEELELLKRQTGKTRAGGSASLFVVLVSLLLGILVGYFIQRT